MVRVVPTSRLNAFFPKSLEAAGQEWNQLFESLCSAGKQGESPARSWHAPAALWEADGNLYVEAEFPGVQREHLDITLEKNVLKIVAERHAPEGERHYWHNERGYGRVERSVALPETVDAESITAEYKDGVLLVKLSKRPETLPKKIEIKS